MNEFTKTANFGKAKANDEHYTTKETAEYIVTKYEYLLKDKRIILPCDSEWSELFKACKAHGLNCEIAQDMYGVDYSKYDICFTNPPFNGLRKFIKYLNTNNVKFLLFAPWSTIQLCANDKQIYYIEDFDTIYKKFNKPDGSQSIIHWGLITNLDEGKAIVESKPDIRIKATDEWTSYRGIWTDLVRCNYLKYEYHDFVGAGRLKVRLKQKKFNF